MKKCKSIIILFLGIILGIILTGGVAVYAYTQYASEISYNKNGSPVSVQEALNELYTMKDNTSIKEITVSGSEINNTYICESNPRFFYVWYSRDGDQQLGWIYGGTTCSTIWEWDKGSSNWYDSSQWFTIDSNGIKFKDWSTNKGDYSLYIAIIK